MPTKGLDTSQIRPHNFPLQPNCGIQISNKVTASTTYDFKIIVERPRVTRQSRKNWRWPWQAFWKNTLRWHLETSQLLVCLYFLTPISLQEANGIMTIVGKIQPLIRTYASMSEVTEAKPNCESIYSIYQPLEQVREWGWSINWPSWPWHGENLREINWPPCHVWSQTQGQ